MIRRHGLIVATVLGGSAFAPAKAAVIYDPGTLEFASAGQSIWGPGDAFRQADSRFLGTVWTNKTATIGGIAGSANEVVVPGIDPVFAPIFEPRVFVPTPTWSNPFAGYFIGCGCTKNVQITPGIGPITADTRTGAEIRVNSSGKVGIEFGYSIDSGSIDSTATFAAQATLPDVVSSAEFFSIGTSSIFQNGTIETQSPKAEAYMSAIMQLSGSVQAQACALTFGCTSGATSLPTVDLDQRILSIDPGSLKVLDGILPSGEALAEVPIANRSLTLQGGVSVAPPAVGFKLSDSSGLSLVNTLPVAAVTADLAEISLNLPDIATSGVGSGERVTSTGRDDLVSAQLDIDGAATILAGLPPTGLNFDLIDTAAFKFGVSLDLIDVDAGPVLGLRQDFELEPTLMVHLEFSNPLSIAGMTGLQSSWTGSWSGLPQFAITETTTFTPTFWLDALFTNNTLLDLGLVGTLDVLKLGATATVGGIDLLHFNPISLNNLLGLDNTLFETDKLLFPVFDNTFALGGFNMQPGQAFTLRVADVTGVPEPGSLWLILAGLLAWPLRAMRFRQRVAVDRA